MQSSAKAVNHQHALTQVHSAEPHVHRLIKAVTALSHITSLSCDGCQWPINTREQLSISHTSSRPPHKRQMQLTTRCHSEVLEHVLRPHSGLFVIGCGAGTGKTHMAHIILDSLKTQNATVNACTVPHKKTAGTPRTAPLSHFTCLLCTQIVASTSAAATTHVHPVAQTVDAAFGVFAEHGSTRRYLMPINCEHPLTQAIAASKVIIIHEASMMSTDLFNLWVCQRTRGVPQ